MCLGLFEPRGSLGLSLCGCFGVPGLGFFRVTGCQKFVLGVQTLKLWGFEFFSVRGSFVFRVWDSFGLRVRVLQGFRLRVWVRLRFGVRVAWGLIFLQHLIQRPFV